MFLERISKHLIILMNKMIFLVYKVARAKCTGLAKRQGSF